MDQNELLIEKLEQYALKLESMGDVETTARLRVDTMKLKEWLAGGQIDACPVDLSLYDSALEGARPAPLEQQAGTGINEPADEPANVPAEDQANLAQEIQPEPIAPPTAQGESEESKPDVESLQADGTPVEAISADEASEISMKGQEPAEPDDYVMETETPEQVELRHQLEQARTYFRSNQFREALALVTLVEARAQGDVKARATDLLDQARHQLNVAFDKAMSEGQRAHAEGDIESARKKYEAAQRLKPDDKEPRRALMELGGELDAKVTGAHLTALRTGLKERNDIRRLGEAVYEAEALDGEEKLPAEIATLLTEARTAFKNIRIAQGEVTTQMRFGDLAARSKAVEKIRNMVAGGEKLIYDSTLNIYRPSFELLEESVKQLERASADVAQYELDLAEKQKVTHPRYALTRLEKALEQPFSEDYKRLLQQKIVDVGALVKVQEKSENLQEEAQKEADPIKAYALVLQAQQTFPHTPGIAEQVAQKRITALNALVVRLETLFRDAEISLGVALKSGHFKETRSLLKQAEEAAAGWPEEVKPMDIRKLLDEVVKMRQDVIEKEKLWAEYSEQAATIREQVLDSGRRAGALDLFHKLSEEARFKIFPDLAILTSEIDNYTDVGEKLVNAQTARADGDWARVLDLADKAIKSQKAGQLSAQFTALYDQASLELSISRAQALLEGDDIPEANNILSSVLNKEKGTAREGDLRQRLEQELSKIQRCILDSQPMQVKYDQAAELVGLRDSILLKTFVNPAFALRQARVKADGDVSNPEMRALINSFRKGESGADPSPEELSQKVADVLRQDLTRRGVSERLEALRLFRYVGGDVSRASESEKEAWRLSLRTAEARRAGRLLIESLRQEVLPAMTRLYENREEKQVSDTSLLRLSENARGLREAQLLETDYEKDVGRWYEVEWGRRQSLGKEKSGDWSGAVKIWEGLLEIHPTLEVQNGWRRLRIQQKVELARDYVMNHHDGEQAVTLLQDLKAEPGIGNSWEVEKALVDAYVVIKNFPSAYGSLDEAIRFAPKDKSVQAELAKKRKELDREKEIQTALEGTARAGSALDKIKILQEYLSQTSARDSRRLREERDRIFRDSSNDLLALARDSQKTGSDEGKLKAVMALVDLQGLEEAAAIPAVKRQSTKKLVALHSELTSVAESVIRSAQEFEPATMTLEQAVQRGAELANRLQILNNIMPLFESGLEAVKERLQKRQRETARLMENLKSLQEILAQAMEPEIWEMAIRSGDFQLLDKYSLQIGGLSLRSMHEVQDFDQRLGEWKEIRNYMLREMNIIEKKFSPEDAFEEVGVLLVRLLALPKLRPDGSNWERLTQAEYDRIHGWMNEYLRVNDLFTEGDLVGWAVVGEAARKRQVELASWQAWDKECRLKMEDLDRAGALTAAHTPSTELRIKKRDLLDQQNKAEEIHRLLENGPLDAEGNKVPITSSKARALRAGIPRQLEKVELAGREAQLALEDVDKDPNLCFPTPKEFADTVAQKDWFNLEKLLSRARIAGPYDEAGKFDEQKQRQINTYTKVLAQARQVKSNPTLLDKLKGRK